MTVEQFIEEYANELFEGNAAYFIGAGVSVPSKLPTWHDLIKPHADRISITNLDNRDLSLVAQFVINEETGNRGPFINAISKKLRKRFSPNSYHESIAKTNIKTIWTTNYDTLIETAFASQITDVKVSDEAITRSVPDAQVEIIKMHGCIFHSNRNEIVITQSDYEDFFINKPAIAQRLRMDLLQKSFLFIGYGYGDQNIQNIVTEARRLASSGTRQHYLITKAKNTPEFQLWSNNLKRYGIRVVEIQEHTELDGILEKLSLKSRGKSIFITGSHEGSNNDNAKELGTRLAYMPDIILNDGQSSGVMRAAAGAYMDNVIKSRGDINRRLRFYANPYAAREDFANDPSLIPLLKQWRSSLFKATQIVVAFDGGMGTQAEIEKALELGCIVIPFFTNHNSSLYNFLVDARVVLRINKFDTEYIEKVKDGTVNIEDLYNLIDAIFKSR